MFSFFTFRVSASFSDGFDVTDLEKHYWTKSGDLIYINNIAFGSVYGCNVYGFNTLKIST